jgi:hypothetical protein
MDVNNRHNGPSYGWARVICRTIVDFLLPNTKRGDTSYTWSVNGKTIPGKGHLFTFAEIKSLLRAEGLVISDAKFINYDTGAVSRSRFMGQIVLKITLPNYLKEISGDEQKADGVTQ